MSAAPVLLSERDGVGYLTLNAPPRNEMNSDFFHALAEICSARLGRLQVRGLVVHGAGRHFSSGADLTELHRLTTGSAAEEFMRRNTEAFLALERFSAPVVAAIAGCCLGAGMELALACHYRIAAPNAVLGLPETTFGLIPGCGGTVRLPAVIGRGRAVRMILTGQSMGADEALGIGLVDAVVDRRELLNEAVKLIDRLDGGVTPRGPDST